MGEESSVGEESEMIEAATKTRTTTLQMLRKRGSIPSTPRHHGRPAKEAPSFSYTQQGICAYEAEASPPEEHQPPSTLEARRTLLPSTACRCADAAEQMTPDLLSLQRHHCSFSSFPRRHGRPKEEKKAGHRPRRESIR
jgi:hypothetical protein